MKRIMLDSGAFSAWTRGAVIDIDQYAEFILKHQDIFEIAVNLDVLNDGKASYDNWKYLRSKGCNVMPVYHLSTNRKYLERYLKNTDYICLGAIAKLHTTARLKGLTYIWDQYLIDRKTRLPKVKVHGLGLTAIQIMRSYPWYSVDSKAWLDFASYGKVIMPPLKNGKWSYVDNYIIARVSVRKSGDGLFSMVSVNKDSLSSQIFMKYIEEKGYVLGKSELVNGEEVVINPGLCNNGQLREELNATYFIDLVNTFPKWPWPMENTNNYLL